MPGQRLPTQGAYPAALQQQQQPMDLEDIDMEAVASGVYGFGPEAAAAARAALQAQAALAAVEASGDDSPNNSGGSRGSRPSRGLPPADTLAAAQGVLSDLPPALVPLVIAKSTARRGKGGRQPAADPRLDPAVDPKRAKRILANRNSAAKSKLKQKLVMEGLKTKHQVLLCQQQVVARQVAEMKRHLANLERENAQLEEQVQQLHLQPDGAPSLVASC